MTRTTKEQIQAQLNTINSYLKGSGLIMKTEQSDGGWRIKMTGKDYGTGSVNVGYRGTKGEIYNTLFAIQQTLGIKNTRKRKSE